MRRRGAQGSTPGGSKEKAIREDTRPAPLSPSHRSLNTHRNPSTVSRAPLKAGISSGACETVTSKQHTDDEGDAAERSTGAPSHFPRGFRQNMGSCTLCVSSWEEAAAGSAGAGRVAKVQLSWAAEPAESHPDMPVVMLPFAYPCSTWSCCEETEWALSHLHQCLQVVARERPTASGLREARVGVDHLLHAPASSPSLYIYKGPQAKRCG